MTTLPNKPSELITLALDDLEKVEADPDYDVNMDIWHAPDGEICHVCLAGAVMAKSLCVPQFRTMYPSQLDDFDASLEALDDFRIGNTRRAFTILDLGDIEGEEFERSICDYKDDPEQFKADMRQLADDLRKAGY